MDIKTKHSLPPSVKNYKHLINLEIFPANLKWAKLIKGLIFLPRRKTTAKNDRIRIATSSSINVERRGKKNWGLLQRWADTSGISRQQNQDIPTTSERLHSELVRLPVRRHITIASRKNPGG